MSSNQVTSASLIELCQCGQSLDRIHCPNCASLNVRKRGGKDIICDQVVFRFECRRCAEQFRGDQWGLNGCHAPSALSKRERRFAESVARIRQEVVNNLPESTIAEANELRSSGDTRKALSTLFGNVGNVSQDKPKEDQ